MIHLRIVSPPDRTDRALDLLTRCGSVVNVITLRGAAQRPEGDVILCDVAREDTSVVLSDLRGLRIHQDGSIALERIDTELSAAADRAERSARGAPADAVVWEEVSSRTSEESTLSASFAAFMVLAAIIASIAIYLDSPILVVGAMVVGPEFGPLAAFSVAAVQLRWAAAARSLVALAVGFPLGITAAWLATLILRGLGAIDGEPDQAGHSLARIISHPDALSFVVAFCAGVAGMISLTTAKSGALIGVLISVTTIPAAANIGVATAFEDWPAWRGSLGQLALNLAAILLAGVLTLGLQRWLYTRRRTRHRRELSGDPSRE